MTKTNLFWLDLVKGSALSQENHLRVGSLEISFKDHVKNLGVYINATLSMVKHIDHISRSACLEIRGMSSIRHRRTTKATAHLMCSFVLSRLDFFSFSFLMTNGVRYTACKKFKITRRKSDFANFVSYVVSPQCKLFAGYCFKNVVLLSVIEKKWRYWDALVIDRFGLVAVVVDRVQNGMWSNGGSMAYMCLELMRNRFECYLYWCDPIRLTWRQNPRCT